MKRLLVALTLLTVAGCAQKTPQPPKPDPVSQIEAIKKALSNTDPETYAKMNKSSWRNWQEQDEIKQIEAKYENSEYKDATENLPEETKQLIAKSAAKSKLHRNCMKERIGTDYLDAAVTCAKLY